MNMRRTTEPSAEWVNNDLQSSEAEDADQA